MLRKLLFALGLVGAWTAVAAGAPDWIFDNGPYTRNPKTGKRVDQFKKPRAAVRIPYDKYFSEDGPAPPMPYWYYEQDLYLPGGEFFSPFGYGGGWVGGFGGFGFPSLPYGTVPVPLLW